MPGTVDGESGDHLLYAPPLTLTPAQADDLIAILDDSLAAVASEVEQSSSRAVEQKHVVRST